jgi:methylated-DNA-protein-cysteine methyltransferase-like protein
MAEKDFFERVYEVVRKVPEGRVTTYGAIARYLGSVGSSRMVGWAMNNCHAVGGVPAHRVVNRKGLLTGKHHFPGTDLMEQLLWNEGVEVKKDQVIEFEKLFWDPTTEIK